MTYITLRHIHTQSISLAERAIELCLYVCMCWEWKSRAFHFAICTALRLNINNSEAMYSSGVGLLHTRRRTPLVVHRLFDVTLTNQANRSYACIYAWRQMFCMYVMCMHILMHVCREKVCICLYVCDWWNYAFVFLEKTWFISVYKFCVPKVCYVRVYIYILWIVCFCMATGVYKYILYLCMCMRVCVSVLLA